MVSTLIAVWVWRKPWMSQIACRQPIRAIDVVDEAGRQQDPCRYQAGDRPRPDLTARLALGRRHRNVGPDAATRWLDDRVHDPSSSCGDLENAPSNEAIGVEPLPDQGQVLNTVRIDALMDAATPGVAMKLNVRNRRPDSAAAAVDA